ncbi:MAG: helix-turn-helix domain-containing protein [Ligilactobacillus animalis]|uniref:helix-turn-helix transcriptional regulator n=1 Tax=Ligilactobacillus animalis TaxID=1605 RepID=UPI00242A58EA|nr:helix-turn-helix transcriptional regulator [Ligilactobacillus animalis]MCI5941474.1 helix-turn-helix domain-containing protein [Ligilactobacillus animalis]MDY2992941.1 helix-turn-helix transcriptional regulator [Ligilactobacillus animalis]
MELNLKMLRASKNFSQDELAEAIGVSQTTISSWEKGKSVPNAKNIYELAKLYSVEPTVIFNALFKQKT